MYNPRGLSITKGLYGVLYTDRDNVQGGIMHGGIIYGRRKNGGKRQPTLAVF